MPRRKKQVPVVDGASEAPIPRKRQPVPVIHGYEPTPQRDPSDLAVQFAREWLARFEIGNPDDTVDVADMVRDLLVAADEMDSLRTQCEELKADVEAADQRAKEAETREKERSDDAARRIREAQASEQTLRTEFATLNEGIANASQECIELRRAKHNLRTQLEQAIHANEELVAENARLKDDVDGARQCARINLESYVAEFGRNKGSVRQKYAAYSGRARHDDV